ncbi:MAG: alpha/beta hydrolase [Dehalococcoidia bacterium]
MASPQLQTLIDIIRARPRTENPTIEQLRAGMDLMSANLPLAEGVGTEPVDAGGVPGEWLTPEGAAGGGTLLFLHGGGYVIGSVASHRSWVSRITKASAARTLLIDYRLGPEHPFPAAIEDATAVYRWLLAQGVDPARLAIAGDSAGGGLTAATLLALRDAGDTLPAVAALISPWLDLACAGESMSSKAEADPILSRELLQGWGAHYLNGADARAPLASPVYADLAGLPPLLVQVGTAEVLLDDSLRFAERARSAGVDVTLEPWDDMLHVWHMFYFILPEGQQAIERVGAWLGERVAGR